jgi:hypothetical protein
MDLSQLHIFVERLRKEAIGDPAWIDSKKTFEYQRQSADVVAVLKIVRAAHGVSALNLLCRSGLFIDLGVIVRCVNDCNTEVFFLLENFPDVSKDVSQFVHAFFHSTIDEDLQNRPPAVQSKKIRNAMVRVLKGQHDDATSKVTNRIYETFSGYVHANYAHIMEVYGGPTKDFNLAGIPSMEQCEMRMEHVELAAGSVLHAAAFAARALGLEGLCQDIIQSWQ